MAFTNPVTDMYKNQYDNLFETTAQNPYLKYSRKASKNKALNTTSKGVIPAINELKTSSDTINTTLINGLAAQNKYLGDFANDKELYNSFKGTGYKSIADGVIALKEEADNAKAAIESTTKEIVFVFPKVSTTTIFTEIYVPFKYKITKMDAHVSNVDNNRSLPNSEIGFTLQHKSNDSITFDDIQSLEIASGDSFATISFSNPIEKPEGVLKVKIDKYPKELKNLSIIVTVSKES